jgi:hypothetical protein
VAKFPVTQASFTSGELSPRSQGRTDLDGYARGLKQCRNAHPVLHGGVKRRAGTEFLAQALTPTADRSLLVPFIAGRSKAWMVEFGELTLTVFDASGASIGVTLTTPYAASLLGELDWAQSDSTLYLFFPYHRPMRLQRLGSGTWVLSDVPFRRLPFGEIGARPESNAVLSSAAVGSRTLTASPGVFRAADVGRIISHDAGLATVTSYSSATTVTVNVTRAFPSASLPIGQWVIEGSPRAVLVPTPNVVRAGESTNLTLSIDGWRPSDVGSMVRINGGLVEITAVIDAINASGRIEKDLSADIAAPVDAWALEPSVWSDRIGWPRTGTVHGQRLVCAGTALQPRSLWGSKIGDHLDFLLGLDDDDAYSFTIDGDEATPISYVTSAGDLMVLTESAEYSVRGGNDAPVSPTNVKIKPESNHGCSSVRPALVGAETFFVQRAGRKVRALGYRYDFAAYSSPDVSALSEHITKPGLRSLAWAQEPEQMMWIARTDGALLSLTIDRDQQPAVMAWAQHSTDGAVECVASLPNQSRDDVWMIVRRTINGAQVRYIERLRPDWVAVAPSVSETDPVYGFTVDCGKVFNDGAGIVTTLTGLGHLEGKTVQVVSDGARLQDRTVASGQITVERGGFRVLVGLPFVSTITPLRPAYGQGRTGRIHLDLLDTIGGRIRDSAGDIEDLAVRQFSSGALDAAPQPFTGLVEVMASGWGKGGADLHIEQADPMPLHLRAILRDHTDNSQ